LVSRGLSIISKFPLTEVRLDKPSRFVMSAPWINNVSSITLQPLAAKLSTAVCELRTIGPAHVCARLKIYALPFSWYKEAPTIISLKPSLSTSPAADAE